MKNKLLGILLIGILVIGLTACDKESVKNTIGDKVSTDIVSFTMETAKLALAIDENGKFQDYEYGKNYEYVASKGHVYASLTLIIKNFDRSNLDISNDFIKVKYNGKEFTKFKIVSSSTDLAQWNKTSKISLKAGQELTYRAFVEIDMDAKSLEDDFEVIVDLPKSDGSKEKYNFSITKSDRENAKVREMSLETALKYFPFKDTVDYFENHLNDYETLDDDEITKFVKSNGGYHSIKISSYPYEDSYFLENGNLKYQGLTKEWIVENDTLVMLGRKFTLKKLNDDYCLLVDSEAKYSPIDGLITKQ